MPRPLRPVVPLLLATALLAGCRQAAMTGADESSLAPAGATISVYQLADRLGLGVREISAVSVALADSANLVLIYPDPAGQVFVNGAAVGRVGGIVRRGNRVVVPEALVDTIRAALRPRGEPREPPKEEPRPLSRRTVVIDAGHGGKDPGAISCLGFYEKTVNLKVALGVAHLLAQRGVTARLTRRTDVFIELEDRPAVANRLRADLFVSIHADHAPRRSARGFTLYVARRPSAASQSAADALVRSMNTLGIPNRGVRKKDFIVLAGCDRPAVLIEMGYLSNRQEAALLADATFQNRVARAIARGISAALATSAKE